MRARFDFFETTEVQNLGEVRWDPKTVSQKETFCRIEQIFPEISVLLKNQFCILKEPRNGVECEL